MGYSDWWYLAADANPADGAGRPCLRGQLTAARVLGCAVGPDPPRLISPSSPAGGVALPETTSPRRVRKTFSKLEKVLDVPNLIDIQKASFRWFMGDPGDAESLDASGLRETIDDISPIRDYSERLEVRLGEYTIGDPVVSERECREKDLSFEVPVNVKVVVHQPGHRRDPRADRVPRQLPLDDRAGHVHHQRHRARRRDAAGALAGRLHHGAEGRDQAGLHRQPDAVARLVARARDRQEGPGQRPHRPQAQAADHDAPARAAGGRREHRLRRSTRPTRACWRCSTTTRSSA